MQQSPDSLPAEVVDALRRGNKIEAIKLLRNATGLGLKEAKDAVERIEVGESLAPSERVNSPTLSREIETAPGEVRRSGSPWRWGVAVFAAAMAAYFWFRPN
jgi:hypothetical protein